MSKRIHYYTQAVYAGYLAVGDVIHADNTNYHIASVNEDMGIVTFTTAEGQDLRYKRYADVYATFRVLS